MLIDSHVNLHHEAFAGDLGAVMARASAAGVVGMLTISDKRSSTEAISAAARAFRNVWRSVGVHPHYVKEDQDLTAADLVELARAPDVVGIGECGLDHHYEHSPRDMQERAFRLHIEAARASRLPVIIHTREADEATLAILEDEQKAGAFTPLLHCYTGGRRLADAVVAMGGYVSFAGIVTFKAADNVREVARTVPLDRLLVETDCPYLAPVPHRGRRCEPAHVADVAAKLAEIRGLAPEALAAATSENFFRLFTRAKLSGAVP
ncbi:MAG: TatD family hydrolase [Parvularculaceae bacterium]